MNNINKTKIIKNISIGLGVLTTMGVSAFLIVKCSRPSDPFDGLYYEAKKILTKKDGFEWDGNKLSFSAPKRYRDLDDSNSNRNGNNFRLQSNELIKKIYECISNSRISIDFKQLEEKYERDKRTKIDDFIQDSMIVNIPLVYKYKSTQFSHWLSIKLL